MIDYSKIWNSVEKAVSHLLIPFVFEQSDWEKIEYCNGEPSNEYIDKIKKQKENKEIIDTGTLEWFSYCFKNDPVDNMQMIESPLLTSNSGTLVKRINATERLRVHLGLHQKENWPCYIGEDNIEFRFGKIRLLFFKMGIGVIHLETESKKMMLGELLNFNEQLGAIHKKVRFSYKKKVDQDRTETVRDSISNLIKKILEAQNYIQLKPYEKKKPLTAYLLEYFYGKIDQEEKLEDFEMLRNRRRSSLISEETIPPEKEYRPFKHISWLIGNKTLICFGDLSICSEINRKFLIRPDGMVNTINLNYTTIYAYLIALKLSLRNAERSRNQELVEMLTVLPKERLSEESHINRLFDEYVRPVLFRLDNKNVKSDRDCKEGLNEKISALSSQMDQIGYNLSMSIRGVSKKTDYLINQVDLLVSFTDNELKTFLEKERKKLRDTRDANHEEQVGEFISHTASYIDERVRLSGDEIVRKEKEGLQILFGERWEKLLPTSQTSLVSAGALLKRCSDLSTPDFDFSGICICATAALEAELKRVFFDGLLNYMVKAYGDPETADAKEISKYWPEQLLFIENDRSGEGRKKKLRKAYLFTMGKLPFLFGEIAKLSNDTDIQEKQVKQAEMMRSRMSEYLETIVLDCKAKTYELFYQSDSKDKYTCQPECFVWKCEQIRKDYRNKAAHASVMSGEEAASCYERIVTKPDTYEYNEKIAGVILELFSKVDGSKLRENFKEQVSGGLKTISVDVKGGRPAEYSIGQKVVLTDLELTSKGVLRGTIAGSTVGASLSKKYLKEKGIDPRKYLGKRITVRLYRWDENAQKFNAEFMTTERERD